MRWSVCTWGGVHFPLVSPRAGNRWIAGCGLAIYYPCCASTNLYCLVTEAWLCVDNLTRVVKWHGSHNHMIINHACGLISPLRMMLTSIEHHSVKLLSSFGVTPANHLTLPTRSASDFSESASTYSPWLSEERCQWYLPHMHQGRCQIAYLEQA